MTASPADRSIRSRTGPTVATVVAPREGRTPALEGAEIIAICVAAPCSAAWSHVAATLAHIRNPRNPGCAG
jgi:hypothetical protein